MDTAVSIDDELYRKALEVADPAMDETDLFREALKTLIQVQAARHLAALGGSSPAMPAMPRSMSAPIEGAAYLQHPCT